MTDLWIASRQKLSAAIDPQNQKPADSDDRNPRVFETLSGGYAAPRMSFTIGFAPAHTPRPITIAITPRIKKYGASFCSS